MVNPFYVKPASALVGVGSLLSGISARGETDRAAAEKTRLNKVLTEGSDIMQRGTPDEISQFVLKNPEIAKQMDSALKLRSDVTKNNLIQSAKDILLGGRDPSSVLLERASIVDSEGGDPAGTRQLASQGDDAIRGEAAKVLALYDQDAYKEWKEVQAGTGASVGTVSPKDFTVESMSSYEDSGDIKDLVRYRPKTVKIGNVEHIYNNETGRFEPVVDMTSTDLTVQEIAAAENEAERNSRIEFGKQKSKWENQKTKSLGAISSAEQKQTVIRNTADRIKDLMSGWTNRYGTALRALPGSDARTLKGLIDTMKANSAFTTLTDLKASGGTLGAISEAELNLLERAWGALDQGGDATEFVRVLDQLVDQNAGSLQRSREAFNMTKQRFSGSYDDDQRAQEAVNTVSWDEL